MKYRLICINLERRKDRRESMEKILPDIDYEFFKAFDGTKINPSDVILNLFKHTTTCLLRQGVIGCALSHYHVWKKLIEDPLNQYYVIIEDDVKLDPDFKPNLDKIFDKLHVDMPLVFIGMTPNPIKYEIQKDLYLGDTSYSIHPLDREMYYGGAFGYILSKKGALYLVDYVIKNGIKMVIDYLIYHSGLELYESHPQLIFTDSVQHSTTHVDSDIQHNFTRIIFNKIENDYQYDDYVFYPNRDSPRNDIAEIYADIPNLKNITDKTIGAVAFNTCGWIKNCVTIPDKFTPLENKYHVNDGLFVKKSYLKKMECNYTYDDYVFFPNQDSPWSDINSNGTDIPTLKSIADKTEQYVAFNTYGWLKYTVTIPYKFTPLEDKYHIHDGLFVKKDFLQKMECNHIYDDYVFFRNKDSPGNDIREICTDIPSLKNIADKIEHCMAFNTYGWIKYNVAVPEKFTPLEDKYHIHDGLYVKKIFLQKLN